MSDASITLTLDGALSSEGFRVSLSGFDGTEVRGKLPAHPDMAQTLEQWRQAYRSIPNTTRITPKDIVYQGAMQVANHCRHVSATLQAQFETWLNASDFLPIDRQLRESLSPNQSLKLMIRSDDWQVYRLPWHRWDWVDRHPQVAIAFSPITRRSSGSRTAPTRPKQRVQILAIFGSSEGLDLSVDHQILQTLPDADVTLMVEPARSQLNDALWEQPWDMVCFSGHSQTQAQVGRLWINAKDHLTLDELRYGLRQARDQGLRLALLNSCDGLGLAQDLLALNLPQVMVMREPVPDAIAHRFLANFLAAYARGQSLSHAHRIAQERLQGLEKDYPCASWLPILFENDPAIAWSSLLTPQLNRHQRTVPAQPSRSKRLLSGLLGSAIVLGLRGMGSLESLELQAFDQWTRMTPPELADDRILLVTIDDEDIRYQEKQGMQLTGSLAPEALRSLISKLRPLEPISVGLDLYRSQPVGLPEDLPLFGICKVPAPDGGDRYGVDPPPDLPSGFVGFSDFVVDDDDRLRRQLLAIKNTATTSNCAAQNSLNLLLATHYLQSQGYHYQLNSQKAFDWGKVTWSRLTPNAGGYHQVDAAGYQLLLNYRASPDLETIATAIPLRDWLQDRIPPTVRTKLKQRMILIGTTALSASDRWQTPLHTDPRQTSSGLYLQAQMVSQLISSVEDERSLMRWWPEWLEMLWIGAWTIGAGLVFRGSCPKAWGLVAGWGLLLSLVCYGGFIQSWWLPWIPALVGIIATCGLIGVQRYTSRL